MVVIQYLMHLQHSPLDVHHPEYALLKPSPIKSSATKLGLRKKGVHIHMHLVSV